MESDSSSRSNNCNINYKPVRLQADIQRCPVVRHLSKLCPTAQSKETRGITFDKLRSRRIADTMESVSDSVDDSRSILISRNEHPCCENLDDKTQNITNNLQQLLEKKKILRKQTLDFSLKLTKCLRLCKRKVDALSPKVFRPNVGQLRGAVDAALCVAEKIKNISICSITALQRMIQRAATISNLMYVGDIAQHTSSYYRLVRIRSILKSASRVATLMHGCSIKITSTYSELRANGNTLSTVTQSNSESIEVKNGKVDMEVNEPDKENKAEDVYMTDEPNKLPRARILNIATCKRTQFSGRPHCAIGERKRAEARLLRSVEKQTVFKTSLKKNRFSSYASGSTLRKITQHNSETCNLLKLKPRSQENTHTELSTTTNDSLSTCTKKTVPLKYASSQQNNFDRTQSLDIPPTHLDSTASETYFSWPSDVYKYEQSQRVQHGSDITINYLADVFESKCKISEPVKRPKCSSISFEDPRACDLTSAVVSRENYPRVTLQDGGVRFVLRESPLKQVLQHRQLQAKHLNTGTAFQSNMKFPQKECSLGPKQVEFKPNNEEADRRTKLPQKSLASSVERPPKMVTSFQSVRYESPTVSNARIDTASSANTHCHVSFTKTGQGVMKCDTPKVKSSVSNPQGKNNYGEAFVDSKTTSTKTMVLPERSTAPLPSIDVPSAKPVAADTSFTNLSIKLKELKSKLLQSIQQKQRLKQEISMDVLANMLESNCKISDSVHSNYSSISFKDPRGHELTFAVVPREKYPRVKLQDGGVRFVLRESPLTKILKWRILERQSLDTLPQSMLNLDQKQRISNGGVELKSFTPCSITFNSLLLSSDRRATATATISKPATFTFRAAKLKQTKRNVSNVLAVRNNLQPEREIQEYRRIVVANASMSSNTVRLGKRTAAEAGLPIPVNYTHA